MTALVEIDYTNWRGERAKRLIRPHVDSPLAVLEFIETEWHPETQWILNAYDVAKKANRSFAMKDIHGWEPK